MQRLEKGYRKGAVGQMAAYALVGSLVWHYFAASAAGLPLKPKRLALFALMDVLLLATLDEIRASQGSLHEQSTLALTASAATCRPSRAATCQMQTKGWLPAVPKLSPQGAAEALQRRAWQL